MQGDPRRADRRRWGRRQGWGLTSLDGRRTASDDGETGDGAAPLENEDVGSPLSARYRTTTLGIVSLITLIGFESLAVSTAMPVVAVDLHAVRDYGLAFSLFLTTAMLGIVVSGGWCDARGPRWPARVGLLLFAGGLVICGLATRFGILLAGRAVAGAGGGLLIVATYVVVADVFPSGLQPKVFSMMSAGWVLPGLIGPVVAGWLAESVSWRAVFLLVPPLTVPPALALLPRLQGRPEPPADAEPGSLAAAPSALAAFGGRMLAGVGLAGGVLALQWGLGELARASGLRLWLAGVAVGAGVVLAGIGFYRLVPAGTLRLRRGLPTVIILRGLYTGTFFGVEAFVPLMLVTERGLSALQAGAALTGGTLGWTAGSFVQSRSRLRLPRHLLLVSGAALLGIGIGLMVLTVRPPVSPWAAVGLWAVAALGMGVAITSTSVLALRYSEPGEEGRNSSALQLSDSLGGVLGIGLAGAAFAAWHRPNGSDAGLFTAMWLGFAAVALVAALVGFRGRQPPLTV